MKLLNILSAVVAVHIAVLVLAIAIPGCRTTGNSQVGVADSSQPLYPAPASSPISAAPEMSDADLNPALVNNIPSNFDPYAQASVGVSSAGNRASPTRPSPTVTRALDPQPVDVATNPVSTYTVQRGDNLWTLARRNDLSRRELASANGLAANAGLRVGQVMIIPGKRPTVAAAVAAAPEAGRTYQIRPGDTLGKIARAHGLTVAELKAYNRLTSDMIRAGAALAIPASAAVQPAEETVATTTETTRPAAAAPAGAFKHTVAPGESMTVIASRYGVKIGDIAFANKVRDPSLIRPGQELIIPGWEAPTVPEEEAPIPTLMTRPEVQEIPTLSTASDDLDAGFGEEDLSNIPTLSTASDDLDAGFGEEDLSNIPVITVEDNSDNSGDPQPPVFE